MSNAAPQHELLDDFCDVIARELIEQLKLPTAQAGAVGMHIAQALAKDFAGQQLYVPAFYSLQVAAKHQQIYDEYKSKEDIPALCRKYEITERTLYRILARVGAADIAKRQPQLFKTSEPS